MSEPDPLPATTRVGRVALTVADLDRLTDFYRTVVGLRVHERTAERAVLGDGETALLELVADPGAGDRPRAAAGLFHTAFRVPTRVALGAALERVEAHSHLSGASDHRVSEALYLSDPEGNGIEIYRDRPGPEWPTDAEGHVRMETLRLPLDEIREGSDGSETVPAGTDVGHVHVEVTDLSAARAFYVDTVRLGVRQEAQGVLFLAAGDYHHHVGANVWNGRSEPRWGRGLAWFELVVPDVASLETVRARLDASEYETRATESGFEATDDDGITVRFRRDGSA